LSLSLRITLVRFSIVELNTKKIIYAVYIGDEEVWFLEVGIGRDSTMLCPELSLHGRHLNNEEFKGA
jgi:hypothetical protein